eukprot:13763049-Ditylum_brightwellii.AAC.1
MMSPQQSHPAKQVGVPVGAVRISSANAQTFRKLLDKALKLDHPIRFRGVDRLEDDDDDEDGSSLPSSSNKNKKCTRLLIHLPHQAASALDSNDYPEVMKFLEDHSATYISGLRKRQPKRNSNATTTTT